MSYKSYDDLYGLCNGNNKGKYFMMIADIVNSRSLSVEEYKATRKQLLDLQIYFTNSRGYTSKFDSKLSNTLVLGDAVGVMIKVDSSFDEDREKALFKNLLNRVKKPCHFASGYCDTTLYEEGGSKYYSGYLFKKLTEKHK